MGREIGGEGSFLPSALNLFPAGIFDEDHLYEFNKHHDPRDGHNGEAEGGEERCEAVSVYNTVLLFLVFPCHKFPPLLHCVTIFVQAASLTAAAGLSG
jgi:hypothetical protein